MGRLGLTLRDLISDPGACRVLGQALGVRYFAFGALTQTPGGLDWPHTCSTWRLGPASAGAAPRRDRGELKCRLGDLARLTLLDPLERDRQARLASECRFFSGKAASS